MGSKSKVFKIIGNPKNPEPAEHRIEFPGGTVNITRCSDGDYWAHILVNRQQAIPDTNGMDSALAEVIESRVTCSTGVLDIEATGISQIAVKIRIEK